MSESFYCFYPSTPLWVGHAPDFSRLNQGGVRLEDIMSEEVIRSHTDNASVVFCRDGMCMVWIDALDKQMQDIRRKGGPGPGNKLLNEQWLALHRQYMHYLNAMQLLLDSALLQMDQFAFFHSASLRLADVFPVIIDERYLWPVLDYNYGITGFHAVRDSLHRGRRPESYDRTRPIEEDDRIRHRRETAEPLFQHVIAQFYKAQDDADLIDILNQTLVAVDNYNVANYSVALVQAWFLIELFVNMCWVQFLLEQQTSPSGGEARINAERRQLLTGRDFTAAIISNVLELNGRIDTEVFKKIDSLRKARNRVSHNLDKKERIIGKKLKKNPTEKESKGVSTDDCRMAFQVVDYFIEREYKITLGIGQRVF